MSSSNTQATFTSRPYHGIRQTIKTSLPFSKVTGKLNEFLKMDSFVPMGFEKNAMKALSVRDKEAFESAVNERVGPYEFMLFGTRPHDGHLAFVLPKDTPPPKIIAYTIGNPLIAQTMLKHDAITGLHVPVRVIVTGNDEWCNVDWDLPSGHIAIGERPDEVETQLRAAAEALDKKLEAMLRDATDCPANVPASST